MFYRSGDMALYADPESACFEESDGRLWYYDGVNYFAPAGGAMRWTRMGWRMTNTAGPLLPRGPRSNTIPRRCVGQELAGRELGQQRIRRICYGKASGQNDGRTASSKQLGRYQATESIGILLGVLLVIAGCITMFIRRDPLLICALVFPGVALLFLSGKARPEEEKSADAGAAGRGISARSEHRASALEPKNSGAAH